MNRFEGISSVYRLNLQKQKQKLNGYKMEP